MQIKLRRAARKFLTFVSNVFEKRYYGDPIKGKDISDIISHNRETLDLIDCWVSDDIYDHSIFSYGIPNHIRSLIDKKINNEVTYTDIICHFIKKLENSRYLKIN